MTEIANLWATNTVSGGQTYFEYETAIAREVMIPWLQAHLTLDNLHVADFGCHQGGILDAIREDTGVASGVGYDLSEENIRVSPFVSDARFSIHVQDILTLPPQTEPFDLVLIHDVLEHIPDYQNLLKHTYQRLSPGGHVFISFPPYFSPFGGHQHMAANWGKLVPYLHYLPDKLLFDCLTFEDNAYMSAENAMEDVVSVRKTRLTMARAERAFAEAGFKLHTKTAYLLRPEFKIRYGLPPVAFNLLGEIPVLGELLTMGVFYLIEKPR